MKHVLSIAGSDCSGGAGIQADLKTFGACGVYGMSVITALTAQNTCGVQGIMTVPGDFVRRQLDAVSSDISIHAIKIGMLGQTGAIQAVAEWLAELPGPQRPPVVLDPVMIAKGGHPLLAPEAQAALMECLIPRADLVTPNIPEAQALTGMIIGDDSQAELAGQLILNMGARAVLIKGGHREGPATDILVTPQGSTRFTGPRLDARHTHGTGCSLSSALASFLAQGLELKEAVLAAKDYVTLGISRGLAIGRGTGPIHHYARLWDLAGIP